MAAVVGNEDGAHHVSAILYQALNDVGFTLAAQAVTYWNDEVEARCRNYKDLPETPARGRQNCGNRRGRRGAPGPVAEVRLIPGADDGLLPADPRPPRGRAGSAPVGLGRGHGQLSAGATAGLVGMRPR